MTPNLQIEYRPIDALLPYARNPRTHSPAQITKIAASIVEFGWTQPILVDGDNGIIAGHGRLAAARKLELPEVPVIELGHLTPAQKRAYVIADNRLALDAGWDDELLALELAELSEAGYDLLMTGFDDDELARMLADLGDAEGSESGDEPDADEESDVPEPPKQPISRPGDVWHLGPHRLICGDASDSSVVATLMQGEQASLCFTSPPYGNQRDYTSGGIADWDGLMRGVFAQVPMAADGQVLVNLGLIHRDNEFIPYWDAWLDWMRSQGWRRFAWYVWDQGPGMPGDWQGRLAPSFEFIFHFNRQTRKPNKTVPCKFAGQETHLRADGSSTAMRGKQLAPIEQIVKLEKEMSQVQTQYKDAEENYGSDLLNLVVAKGYLTKLLGNDAVKSYVSRHEPEILEHFELVVNTVSMEEAVQQQLEADGEFEEDPDSSDQPAAENMSPDSESDNEPPASGDNPAAE